MANSEYLNLKKNGILFKKCLKMYDCEDNLNFHDLFLNKYNVSRIFFLFKRSSYAMIPDCDGFDFDNFVLLPLLLL